MFNAIVLLQSRHNRQFAWNCKESVFMSTEVNRKASMALRILYVSNANRE